jgi:hypothetical protein
MGGDKRSSAWRHASAAARSPGAGGVARRSDAPLRAAPARAYARDVAGDHERERLERRDTWRPAQPERESEAAAPLRELASQVGNRAFSVTVARQGGGILPSGEVHPGVQDMLSATRGGGTGLDDRAQSRFVASLGDLSDVRVHTDDTADRLNRSVSARAFATGTDVYFASGEYNPGSADGDRLIAHELAHVVQQRGAPAGTPLVVSQPGDPLEQEAEAVADELQ